jgi:hypothetical protein
MQALLLRAFLLTAVLGGSQALADAPGIFPVGSSLKVVHGFRFPKSQPRLSFQDGLPRGDAELDQERPFCTFMVKTANAADPLFRVNDELVVTGSARKTVNGLAADISRLQLDPRINVLVCWGIGATPPSLEQIRASLGGYFELPQP